MQQKVQMSDNNSEYLPCCERPCVSDSIFSIKCSCYSNILLTKDREVEIKINLRKPKNYHPM